MNIVAWMTVKNEEWYIPMALRSVIDYVNKVFIIDTGSTDGTLDEIAKFDGNKIDLEVVDGFSQGVDQHGFYNRPHWCNRLIEKCLDTGADYLLNIDADEYFTPNTFKIIEDNYGRDNFVFSTWDLVSLSGHYLDRSDEFGRDNLNYPHVRIVKANPDYKFMKDPDHPEYGYMHAQGTLDGKNFMKWDFASEDICHLHFRYIGPKIDRDFKPNLPVRINRQLLDNVDSKSIEHLKQFKKSRIPVPPPVLEKQSPKTTTNKGIVAKYIKWKSDTLFSDKTSRVFLIFEYDGGGLGDVIMQIPGLRYLKRMYPQKYLTVLIDERYADIYRHISHVDEVINNTYIRSPQDINVQQDDTVHIARGSLEDNLKQHMVVSEFERITGQKYKGTYPLNYEISISKEDMDIIAKAKERMLEIADGRPLVAIGPAFTFCHKMWTSEYWYDLVEKLHNDGYCVAAFGLAKDVAVDNVDIDAKGVYEVWQIPYILDIFEAIFVLNSGMLHIAGINQDIKIVFISPGPFPPEKYTIFRHGQFGYNMTIVSHSCSVKQECLDMGFCKDEGKNFRHKKTKDLISIIENETRQTFPLDLYYNVHKYVTFYYCHKDVDRFECSKTITPELVFRAFKETKNYTISEEDKHRIAVIIPTYNRREEFYRTVEALQNQTYDKWLGVIVDQNNEQINVPKDNFIHIHTPSIRSSGKARNMGMNTAMSTDVDFVCWWDDDDFPHPDYLEKMVKALDDNPESGIACCLINHDGNVQNKGHWSTPSRVLRRSAIRNHKWDSDSGGQDRRWWGQFADMRTVYVDEVLYTTGYAESGGHRDESGSF